MGVVQANHKNLRICTNCGAGYVTNGDPSELWLSLPTGWSDKGVPTNGLCEFCRPTGKYSLKNWK